MSDYNADSQLDCSGLNCPLPVLKTKKAMDDLASGQVLKINCVEVSLLWCSNRNYFLA